MTLMINALFTGSTRIQRMSSLCVGIHHNSRTLLAFFTEERTELTLGLPLERYRAASLDGSGSTHGCKHCTL